MDISRRDALLKEYGEVSSNFRMLTDIRFKLLAFLPIAAAAAAAALNNNSATVPGLALSLFGLVVTLGIVTYNARNDQLYKELVDRAATIERSLGLPDGGFAHRPQAWLDVELLGKKWKVDHGNGIGTIYRASIALWLFGVFASGLELVRQVYVGFGLWFPQNLSGKDPSIWVYLTSLGVAVLLTYQVAKSIKLQSKKRFENMRELAKDAVERAMPFALSKAARDDKFIRLCEQLSGGKEEKIRARLRFYTSVDPNSLGIYLPRGSAALSASHLVALLTDLPPQWVFDCATDRKGEVSVSKTKPIRKDIGGSGGT